jgi:mannose-6-phosphate isomerase-like protein (cupin superfamily)
MPNEVPNMEVLIGRARSEASSYLEVLRVPAMSVGVYVLPAGGMDRQTPHLEDEVYYVVRGCGRFVRGATDVAVRAGDLLFVGAGEPHHFHSIEEELVLVVVFSPAEQPTS